MLNRNRPHFSASRQGAARRGAARAGRAIRGYVHVLLLVFVVLGITMWGLSELLQRSIDATNKVEKQQDINRLGAKRALLEYAVVSPSPINARVRPGWYNAYQSGGVRVPFRRFFLPCPDVSGSSGVSDIFTSTTPACLDEQATYGFLPWREFDGERGGSYEFIRGLGGGDFNEDYRRAHRYTVAGNINDDAFTLNPHRLLRLTTGWLTVAINGEELSDRVAAVVAPQDPLAGGDDDRPEYLTAEELLAASGPGIEVLENPGAENIYDFIDGRGGAVGVVELLDEHLQRFGFLPAPAMFADRSASVRFRPSGVPLQFSVAVSLATPSTVSRLDVVQGMKIDSTVAVQAVFHVRDLPPVYLPSGIALQYGVEDTPALSPPYNIPLAGLETALNAPNAQQLAAIEASRLTDDHPGKLFDFIGTRGTSPLSVEDDGVTTMGITINTPLTLTLRLDPGVDFPVRLADEAYGYFQSSLLNDVISQAGGGTEGISKLPPYAARVSAPPGTYITLQNRSASVTRSTNIVYRVETRTTHVRGPIIGYINVGSDRVPRFGPGMLVTMTMSIEISRSIVNATTFTDQNPYGVVLPAGYHFVGSFDPETREWSLDDTSSSPPVVLETPLGQDILARANVPNGWVVTPGDVGMLPLDVVSITALASGTTLSLSGNAISDLADFMVLYSEASLTLIPFPPPGRPLPAGTSATLPPLPTPLIISANMEFSLPSGGRIIYPPGGQFVIGDNFAFPDDSIAHYPPGAVLRVGLPGGSIFPDGTRAGVSVLITVIMTSYIISIPVGEPGAGFRTVDMLDGTENVVNTNRVTNVQFAPGAEVTRDVVLPFGGVLQLRDVRPVTEGAGVVGARQRLFDIELRGDALSFDGGGALLGTLLANRVVRPFTGVLAAEGMPWQLPTGAILSSDSRVRARFLTSPRRVVFAERDEVTVFAQQYTAAARLLFAPDTVSDIATVSMEFTFDEDVEFSLPPGFALPLNFVGIGGSGVRARTVVTAVDIPENTAIFDPQNKTGIELLADSGAAALLAPANIAVTLASVLTDGAGAARGVLQRRLALFPESDMYVFVGDGVSLIAAGSIVDVLDGIVYPPGGVQRLAVVAEDLQLLSGAPTQIYFSRAATLEIGAGFENFQVSPNGATLSVQKSPTRVTAEMPWIRYALSPGVVTSEGTLTVGSQLRIPPNSHIIVPGGAALDFLSDEINGTARTAADYANLPDSAVLVILPGSTLSALDSGGMEQVVEGPAYVRLDGDAALINLPDRIAALSGAPLIFLNESGNLVDGKAHAAVKHELFLPLPADSRLDIFGNLERRADVGLFGELMPVDNAEFLRDFPLFYAVAAECRRGGALFARDGDCAEAAGEGLEVALEEGEEYILKNELLAPSETFLRAYPPGLRLIIESGQVGNDVPTLTIQAAGMVIAADGLVSLVAAAAPNEMHVPAVNDLLRVRPAESINETEVRAYFSGGGVVDTSEAALASYSYAAHDGILTVFVGGFVGTDVDRAAAKVALGPASNLQLGAGSPLSGVRRGDAAFADGSNAMLDLGGGTVRVALNDYVILNPTDYNFLLTLSSDTAETDLGGNLYFPPLAAGGVFSVAAGLGDMTRVSGGGGAVLTIAPGASIDMMPGYLWQGYIPLAAQRTVVFEESDIARSYKSRIYPSGWPPASVYVRIQPTVEMLNFWGSGLERPEIIDGLSGLGTQISSLGLRITGSVEIYSNTYDKGYLAEVPSLTISLRVRDLADGTVQTVAAGWRPVVVSADAASTVTLDGLMRWNRKNNPLPGEILDSYGFQNTITVSGLPLTLTSVSRTTTDMTLPAFATVTSFVAVTITQTSLQVKLNRGSGLFARPLYEYTNVPIATVTITREVLTTLDATGLVSGAVILVTALTTVTASGQLRLFLHNRSIWGGRLVGTTLTLGSLTQEDAYIDGFLCRNQPARIPFNPPHFQLVGNSQIPVGVAWKIPYLGTRANVITVGGFAAAPASGNPFTLRDTFQRPAYAPLTVGRAGGGYTVTAAQPTGRGLRGSSVVTALDSDMVFYLDRAYNPHSGVPAQQLRFGNEFKLSGPGALVPPFGGTNPTAVEDAYTQRSRLLNAVFNYRELSPLYDEQTGQCVASNDCPAFFDNPDWYPIVGGVVAFDGVQISIRGTAPGPRGFDSLDEDIRLVMPQPQAVVETEGGNSVTIFAGSIIYPRRRLIYPATPIPPGNYELYLTEGPAVAAIDVGPAIGPRPVRLFRTPGSGATGPGDFNYAPVRFNDLPAEPLQFEATCYINPYGEKICEPPPPPVVADVGCIVEPLNFGSAITIVNWNSGSYGNNIDGVSLQARFTGPGIQNEVLNYDGSFSRGVLLNDDGVSVILSYYRGDNRFSLTNYSASDVSVGLPLYNTDIELGNPQSFRRTRGEHFLPAGTRRLPHMQNIVVRHLITGTSHTTTVGSPFSYKVGVTLNSSGDEFQNLRLAHRIDIPQHSVLEFSGYSGGLKYPLTEEDFFTFPAGSQARVLNLDASSWVSAHPYFALYRQGLKFSYGGSTLTIGIGAENDGVSSRDVGGLRVLHYHRSESSPEDEPLSAAPVYTNVWIRIASGARLVDKDTGLGIQLPDNIMLNPVMRTYISDHDGISGVRAGRGRGANLENPYLAPAQMLQSITLVRPALTIPVGARVAIGASGGMVRNVKALIMFSLTPLEATDCPIGEFNVLTGQIDSATGAPAVVEINQRREGIDQNVYETATEQPIALGHPCMWLDVPENLDGDRLFLYRGRRRYVEGGLKARVVSNDRTYLLGGKLVL